MRLKERVVIVTGGARGIGKVYALGLAREGAKVVIADLLDGEPAAEEVRRAGAQALFLKTDVSDGKNAEAMAKETHRHFGRIDGLVNNAAIFVGIRYGPFHEIPEADWDRVMAVNVKGSWLCSRAVYPYMKAQGKGKIVNIASGVFFKGTPNFLHYTSSKGAVVALTRALAREVGKDGICVNAIAPGLTRSEALVATRPELEEEDQAMTKTRAIPRSQSPEDLVGAVVFFLSEGSDFITGQTLVVDGGSFMH